MVNCNLFVFGEKVCSHFSFLLASACPSLPPGPTCKIVALIPSSLNQVPVPSIVLYAQTFFEQFPLPTIWSLGWFSLNKIKWSKWFSNQENTNPSDLTYRSPPLTVVDSLPECPHHPGPPLRKQMNYCKYIGFELGSLDPAHAATSALEMDMNDSDLCQFTVVFLGARSIIWHTN